MTKNNKNQRVDLPFFPKYKVSEAGRVFSYKSDKIDGKEIGATGSRGRISCSCRSSYNGLTYMMTRARFILLTFRGAPGNLSIPEYLELSKPGTGKKQVPYDARHLDGDHTNDHISNLAWGTRRDNCIDSLRLNENPIYKLTEKEKLEICDLYDSGDYKQVDLAKKYGCTQANISHTVNKWDHPLRTPEEDREAYQDFLSKEQVLEVITLLDDLSLSYNDIANLTGNTGSQILNINLGRTYQSYFEEEDNTISFPIRRPTKHRKLTQEKADKIRERKEEGVIPLADEYEVSKSTIYAIWSGRRWNGDNDDNDF